MSEIFGIRNLWNTNGNLELFRTDRSKLVAAVQYWQAAAISIVGETHRDFRCPPPTFRTFTELLCLAAELFDANTTLIREFVARCFGKAATHTPSPSRPTDSGPVKDLGECLPMSGIIGHSESLDPNGEYWRFFDGDEGDANHADLADLKRALEEAEILMTAVLALPEPTASPGRIGSAETGADVEKYTTPQPIAHWARVYCKDRGTIKKWFENGNIKAEQVGSNAWKVAVRDLPSKRG